MGGMMGAPDEPAPGFDLNEFPSLGGPPLPNARGPGAQFGHGVGGGLAWDPDLRWAACSAGWTAWDPPTDTASSRCRSRIPSLLFRMRISPRSQARPGRGGGPAGRRQGRPIRPAGELPAHVSRRSRGVPESRRRRGAEGTRRRARSRHRGRYLGADGGGPFGVAQGGLGGQYPSLHSQGSGASSQGGYDFGGGGGAGTRSASSEAKGGVPPKPMGSPDRYGLLGLLSVIRMSDPDLTTLALGTDLTTLGLNLNSPEPLYKTFGSPWADTPPRPELELLLPACYGVQVSRCHVSVFQKFQQETLLRLYSMPGDEAQLYAADELVARGWGFQGTQSVDHARRRHRTRHEERTRRARELLDLRRALLGTRAQG